MRLIVQQSRKPFSNKTLRAEEETQILMLLISGVKSDQIIISKHLKPLKEFLPIPNGWSASALMGRSCKRCGLDMSSMDSSSLPISVLDSIAWENFESKRDWVNKAELLVQALIFSVGLIVHNLIKYDCHSSPVSLFLNTCHFKGHPIMFTGYLSLGECILGTIELMSNPWIGNLYGWWPQSCWPSVLLVTWTISDQFMGHYEIIHQLLPRIFQQKKTWRLHD